MVSIVQCLASFKFISSLYRRNFRKNSILTKEIYVYSDWGIID